MTSFTENARRYSELGWALVRLHGKVPVGKGWQKTTPGEPDNVAGHWAEWGKRYGMGVVLRTSASGLVVFEYDADEARERYLELLGGELPATPVCRTGSGKLHAYFLDPGDLQKAARDGLELRVGAHQCVVPPSLHPETLEPYEWLEGHEPWLVGCLPVPAAVREFFHRNGKPLAIPERLTPSTRHDAFVTVAAGLRRVGVGEAAILASLRALNAEQGDPPKTDDAELVALARDAMGWRVGERQSEARNERPEPQPDHPERPDHRGGVPASSVTEVLAAVRRYLDVAPDEDDFIVAAMATAVSKALEDEEPLWLLLVGASGGGKTEAIRLLATVADERVDELTRAGLLTWAPGKRAKRVGLLTRLPASSLVTISDFSTVITMGDREARARMFGALRVVYDGRLYRSIGGQPAGEGDELAWEGHLTLVAAATPVVDTHTSFEGALGERWIMLRLAESDAKRARERARFVVDREDVARLRGEAQAAASSLVYAARKRIPKRLSDEAVERLVDVATFVAHARTGVVHEGQGKHRTILGLPTPEEPTRLVGQLHRLARCAVALGLEEDDALRLATAAAIDSVPLARMRALSAIADLTEYGMQASVSDVQRSLKRGNWWAAKWECDALTAIGVTRERKTDDDTFVYELAGEYVPLYASVGSSCTSTTSRGKVAGRGRHIRRGSTPHGDTESDDGIPF